MDCIALVFGGENAAILERDTVLMEVFSSVQNDDAPV